MLLFNNIPVEQSSSQKQLGIVLGSKLDVKEHLKTISTYVNKTIRLICKLQKTLSRQSLLTFYKTFIRPQGSK